MNDQFDRCEAKGLMRNIMQKTWKVFAICNVPSSASR